MFQNTQKQKHHYILLRSLCITILPLFSRVGSICLEIPLSACLYGEWDKVSLRYLLLGGLSIFYSSGLEMYYTFITLALVIKQVLSFAVYIRRTGWGRKSIGSAGRLTQWLWIFLGFLLLYVSEGVYHTETYKPQKVYSSQSPPFNTSQVFSAVKPCLAPLPYQLPPHPLASHHYLPKSTQLNT